MKETPESKVGFSRYENQFSSAIMLMIVLVSFSLFAIIAWQAVKFMLRLDIF